MHDSSPAARRRRRYILAFLGLVACAIAFALVLALVVSRGLSSHYDTIVVATHESASTEEAALEAGTPVPDDASPLPAITLPPAPPGRLTVYFLDVRLGDAIYIRTPSGADAVIDGGDSANELITYLAQLRETAIDVVIATHPHADHVRGLIRVIEELEVSDVWTNGERAETDTYEELDAAIKASGARQHVGRQGETFALGEVRFTLLGPLEIGRNVNDNSIVVRMDCGESSFIFAGDAEFDAERLMIASRPDLDIDVLKLGHHGSHSSTSAAWITATSPRLAIYEARPDNPFGHPHVETLERLAAAHVPTFGTGAAGATISVSTACDDQFEVTPPLPASNTPPRTATPRATLTPEPTRTPKPTSTPRPARTPTLVPALP